MPAGQNSHDAAHTIRVEQMVLHCVEHNLILTEAHS